MVNKKTIKEAFSKRLLDLMREKNMSQKELAKEVDTSQQAIQQYIAMQAAPKMEMFVALADVFGVSCDYLLGRIDAKSSDVTIQDIATRYGLIDTSLKELERLTTIKSTEIEAPSFDDDEPFVDTREIDNHTRAKIALNALNSILSWKHGELLLSYIGDLLYERDVFIYDDNMPIQLTQHGRKLGYDFAPNSIRQFILSILGEMLDDLSKDKPKIVRHIIGLSLTDEKLSESKPATQAKTTKKTTTKKKRTKNGKR